MSTRHEHGRVGTLETRVNAWLAAVRADDWDLAHAVAAVMPPGEFAAVRLAVVDVDRRFRGAAEPLQPCRECRDGKHPNCDGETWDVELDEPAPCPCAANGHA